MGGARAGCGGLAVWNDERRFAGDERRPLDKRGAGRAFDEFDLIAVRRVDKDKPAAG
jgi:hypothetical protein